MVISELVCSKAFHVLQSNICLGQIFYSEYVQMELFLNFVFPTEIEDGSSCSPKAPGEKHVESALITSKFQEDICTEECSNKIEQCMICLGNYGKYWLKALS